MKAASCPLTEELTKSYSHPALWIAAGLLAFAFAFLCAPQAQAQTPADFPSRNIRLIVLFSAGGGVDVNTRLVAQRLTALLGKSVVVENHTGGVGIVAAQLVGNAGNDGHTLLIGAPTTFSVLPALKNDLPFNNLADFIPVTVSGTSPQVLALNPAVEAKTIPELIALLKANPKKYNFTNTDTGGLPHLAVELFAQMSGTQVTHVPYRGTAPAMAEVISGHVHGMIDSLTAPLSAIREGRLRALGVSTPKRVEVLPDVPAIAEFLPGYEAHGWTAIFAAPRTPDHIVRKLHAAIAQLLQEPEVRERMLSVSTQPDGRPPEAFAAFVRADLERWRKVIRAANIVLQ